MLLGTEIAEVKAAQAPRLSLKRENRKIHGGGKKL